MDETVVWLVIASAAMVAVALPLGMLVLRVQRAVQVAALARLEAEAFAPIGAAVAEGERRALRGWG